MKFITPPRRDQLAAIFTQVLGRPIRVEIDATSATSTHSPEPSRPNSLQPASSNRAPSAADRNKALALPAVRQVMQMFDVAVIGIHTQTGPSPIASQPTPAITAAPSEMFDADQETSPDSEQEEN